MVAAVTAGDEMAGSAAANRLAALQTRLSAKSDEIEVARITELSALPEGADSLHRLVMDMAAVTDWGALTWLNVSDIGARLSGPPCLARSQFPNV
jgi:ethanolamine ammonia-lyase large subunit